MKRLYINLFLGFIPVIFLWEQAGAQGWCGTRDTPEYIQFLRNHLLSTQNQRLIIPQINKTINVTAWIVLDRNKSPSQDSADVADAVAGLGGSFGQMGVSFVVCKVNYIENWQFNEWVDSVHEEQAKVLYYQPNTINIYFPANIVEPQDAGGYAPLPPSKDYMVIKTLGALTHEMGHFFGLMHTFAATGTELANGSNCATAGDLICDTEADPDPSGENVDGDCNYIGPPVRDANGDFYEPPTDNIMSYYPCSCRFTPQQLLRMSQLYTSHRGNLW